jgi:hypothetical protein
MSRKKNEKGTRFINFIIKLLLLKYQHIINNFIYLLKLKTPHRRFV